MTNTPHPHPRTGFADEYPFTSRHLDIDGHRYHYLDEGTGPVLLLVHGNPTWSFAWRAWITDLSRDHRVIAVDHIGCGFSDKPGSYDYCLQRHAENLLTLIDSLGLERITLFAHDWGGAIGMTSAVARPDRFARFVLSNTAAFRSRRLPWRIAICRIPLLGALAVRGLNLFCRLALRMAVAQRHRLTPAVRAGYLAPYNTWAHRVAVLRFVQDIPLSPQHPSYETLVNTEAGLTEFADHPLLLVWGERDWCFTTTFLEEFESRFPHAETMRLPEAGHYVFEDAPELILPRVREFLDNHPLQATV